MAFVVRKAVEGVVCGRTWADVYKKVFETIRPEPALTDLNPAITVVHPRNMLRIVASLDHPGPTPILYRFR
jgi:hypothetical protein